MSQTLPGNSSARRTSQYVIDRLFTMDVNTKVRGKDMERENTERIIKAFALAGVDLTTDSELEVRRGGGSPTEERVVVTTTEQKHQQIQDCLKRFRREKSPQAGAAAASVSEVFSTRQWKVPPSILARSDSDEQDVVSLLKDFGIVFPQGSSASYDREKELLTVTNRETELNATDKAVASFLSRMGATPRAYAYGPVGKKAKPQVPYLVAQLKILQPKSAKVNYKNPAYLLCAAPQVSASSQAGDLDAALQQVLKLGGVSVILVVTDKKDAAWAKKSSFPSILWSELSRSELGHLFPDPFFKMGRACLMNPLGGKIIYSRGIEDMRNVGSYVNEYVSTAEAKPSDGKRGEKNVSPAKANAAWLKRHMARQKKAIGLVDKIKNERSCNAAVTKLKKLYGYQGGEVADPCPYPEEMDSSVLENKRMMKLAFAMGAAIERLEILVAEGNLSPESYESLWVIVSKCCHMADDGNGY